MPKTAHELDRVLNAAHATSIVIGIIIGSGIFLVPREMMAATGRSSTVYLAWIFGGLLSLFGAMTYSEIAAMRPDYGGEYAFLKDAYGDLPAFLYMWTLTAIGKPASLATIAAGLIRVLGTFPRFGFFSRPVFAHLQWGQFVAVAILWLVTALNIRGTRESANVQLSLTGLKVLLILTIGGFCFYGAGGHGSWHNFETGFTGAKGGVSGFMIALVAALWAYNGWTNVSQMAGEIKNPQRNLPFALIGGVTLVGALYMLTNAAIQFVLPAAAIAGTDRPAVDAMRLVAGGYGATVVSIGMAISIGATLVGSSLAGARIPFAAARDGLFFGALADVNPRFRTPSNALVLQSVITTLLLLVVGQFQALFSLAVFSQWLAYGLAASTIFVFRKRASTEPRPFSVPGFPAVPILFIAAATLLLAFSIHDQPINSIGGAAVILCGIPVHFLYQRRRSRRSSSDL